MQAPVFQKEQLINGDLLWAEFTTDKYYGYNGGSAPTTISTVRGISSTYLSTPNVLAAAKEHYGCPTALGMLLENQGGSGSAGSHWERTILQNEFMTASYDQ
ncbi:hypothetical protein PPERSA_08017 [Pseudocohnilembus persalinus]|uniref:Uncharacterized protein n=1 Tax=Pseudocohnilembus persalinus TaxID=266149 RepID=A0A0V0R2H4_PSEPJ|nr:hypothetical protein PPERSA_08017 [Pseudocohnilembus persalinus]|eukprot:KRX08706.1 hypothetical protein PPERSA_08017 [Pseudocohnilembus persalinus]